MKIIEKKTVETDVLVDIKCDLCGNTCNTGDCGGTPDYNYAVLSFNFGYTSTRDGDNGNIHICNACFDKRFGDKMKEWYDAGVI
jgi:hypothetical protein